MTEARVPSIVKDYSNENLKRKCGYIYIGEILFTSSYAVLDWCVAVGQRPDRHWREL
jgi:hypothetical protein